eukprot:jgi/Chlat1/8572/Chrsp82S07957
MSLQVTNVTVNLTSDPTVPYASDGFTCLSIHLDDVQMYAGLGLNLAAGPVDPVFYQALKNLIDLGNGLTMRVNSGFGVTFDETQAKTNSSDFNTASLEFISLMGRLYRELGMKIIPVLGWASDNDPKTLNTTFLKYLTRATGTAAIRGVEQANEPDALKPAMVITNGGRRNITASQIPYVANAVGDYPNTPWGYYGFEKVYEYFAREWGKQIVRDRTGLRTDPWIGGAITYTFKFPWLPNITDFFQKYMNESSPFYSTNAFSWHHYSFPNCVAQNQGYTVPGVLNSTVFPSSLIPFLKLASSLKKEVMLTEHASSSCGGVAGVADTYAATLHEIQYMMQTAAAGFTAVCMTTSTASYTPFEPLGSVTYDADGYGYRQKWWLKNTYYSMLVVAEALGESSKVSRINITGTDPIVLSAFMVYRPDNSFRIVLINRELTTTPAYKRTPFQVALQMPVTKGSATFKRLRCDNVYRKSTITYAGQTYDDTTDGCPVGDLTVETADYPVTAYFSINTPSGGSYGSLPAPYKFVQISNYNVRGVLGMGVWYNSNSAVTTMTAAGPGVGGVEDGCGFVYTLQNVPQAATLQLTVRIVSIKCQDSTDCRAGVMVRRTGYPVKTNPPSVFAYVTSGGRVGLTYRTSATGNSVDITSSSTTPLVFPAWVRVSISTTTVTVSASRDGRTWVADYNINADIAFGVAGMTAVPVGVAATSQAVQHISQVAFSNFSGH